MRVLQVEILPGVPWGCSSGVEQLSYKEKVVGAKPTIPTIYGSVPKTSASAFKEGTGSWEQLPYRPTNLTRIWLNSK